MTTFEKPHGKDTFYPPESESPKHKLEEGQIEAAGKKEGSAKVDRLAEEIPRFLRGLWDHD